MILLRRRSQPAGSQGRKDLEQILILLLILWYSPVIQCSASMYECFEDEDLGWVLVSDASVSCDSSIWRTFTNIFAVGVWVLVGAGFPVFIFTQMVKLRKKGTLTADHSYAALFEWYRPGVPYFEAVHMLRKASLILATTVQPDPTIQAALSLSVNFVFLILFLFLQPMVHYPSSYFKGWNLFHLVELLSGGATVSGNIMAIIGATRSVSAG